MHMARTTLNLDEKLIKDAMRATGIKTKTDVVRAGLQRLLQDEAIEFLIKMGGSMPHIEDRPRRRPPITRKMR